MLIGFLLCFCRSDTRDGNKHRPAQGVYNNARTLDSHITRRRVSNCAPVTRSRADGERRAINHSKLKFATADPDPVVDATDVSSRPPRIPLASSRLLDSAEFPRRGKKCSVGPFVAAVKKLSLRAIVESEVRHLKSRNGYYPTVTRYRSGAISASTTRIVTSEARKYARIIQSQFTFV